MMMIPRRKNEFDLFDDIFGDPFFRDHNTNIMKTDIKEKSDKYLVYIDLPGYEKENIKIDITDGYLNVQATVNKKNEEKEEDGKFVRRERYQGTCSRSLYVGEEVRNEDIKAKFKNGILKLEIPKKENRKELPEKTYIQIED